MKSPTLLLACLLTMTASVRADDWPQYRGPDRTGISKETGLLKTWPAEGPRLLWTFQGAGSGYSPPAIVGDRLYTMGARDKTDFLYALDTRTGKEVWATAIGPLRPAGWGDGPCATPTVDGQRMYAVTTWGALHCVQTASGKIVWSMHLKNDLQGKVIHDGRYTESPLIDGNSLICSPGGSKGTVAAFDKLTGKLLWRSKELTDEAVSSSAIVVDVGGVRQYVNLTGKGVASVAARDGKLLWKSPVPAAWIMVPTPIFCDDHVYVTAAYGVGCGLLKLKNDADGTKAELVYRNKVMKNHHSGVVLIDGHVYGCSEPNGWVCQEFKTGKQAWCERDVFGAGSQTYADGRFYCFSEDKGEAALINATPAGWKEMGRFTIPQQTKLPRNKGKIWTPPVVANGQLYLRDQDLIYCYDVKDPAP